MDPALQENLDYLHARAKWDNQHALDAFNTARHNYAVQSQTGTPPSPAPTSIVWESVDDAKATQLYNQLQEAFNNRQDISTIPAIDTAIKQSVVFIPSGAVVSMSADGTLVLSVDPSVTPSPLPPVNPLGAPVQGVDGVVRAVSGDTHKDGESYTAPDGSKWERLTSIAWGPIFLKVG